MRQAEESRVAGEVPPVGTAGDGGRAEAIWRADWTARWPRLPSPWSATSSLGRVADLRRALKVVTPPHRKGVGSADSDEAGMATSVCSVVVGTV